MRNHLKFKQLLRLYVFQPIFSRNIDEDLAEYCNDVSECLNLLCTYFTVSISKHFLSFCMQSLLIFIKKKNIYRWTEIIAFSQTQTPAPFSNRQNVSFQKKMKWREAELSAIWSFNKAMETETDFEVLCTAYSSMIYIASVMGHHNLCVALEVYALRMCHRKTSLVEIQELKSVAKLYFEIGRSR